MEYKSFTLEDFKDLVKSLEDSAEDKRKRDIASWKMIEEIATQESGSYLLPNGIVMSAQSAKDYMETLKSYFNEIPGKKH